MPGKKQLICFSDEHFAALKRLKKEKEILEKQNNSLEIIYNSFVQGIKIHRRV
jgi:hypothetical protein